MCLDLRAVDHRHAIDAAVARQCVDYLKPQALPAPAIEADIDRRV
jgi:hypothetical protein